MYSHRVPKHDINNNDTCIYSQTVQLQTFTTEHALGEGDAIGPHILSAEHMEDNRSSV